MRETAQQLADPPAADDRGARPRSEWRERLPVVASFVFAFGCHAALAAAFVSWSAGDAETGATEIDAITVSLVDHPTAGRARPAEPVVVLPPPAGAAQREATDDKPALDAQAAPPDVTRHVTNVAEPPNQARETAAPAPTETRPGETDAVKPTDFRTAQATPGPRSLAMAAREPPIGDAIASDTATGLPSLPSAPGRDPVRADAASRKAVSAFTRRVVKALAEARPRAQDRRKRHNTGTARVRFIVAPGGGVREASLARSSGDEALDRMALGAVRKALIPPPPAGMTTAQLTYVVPFHFR